MASREYQPQKRPPRRRLVARDIMTHDPVCASPQMSVADCARLMGEHRIGALPIVDGERVLIGIVSDGDLLRGGANGDRNGDGQPAPKHWTEFLGAPATAAEALATAASRHAADVMTTRVICVRDDMPVAEIATILDEWKIKRAPVLNDGRVIGIVSRSDLVRTMLDPRRLRPEIATSDSSIRESLVSHLEQITWLPGGGGIEITVTDGTVILYGYASSSEEAVAIEYLAEGVPGVRAVESYLRVGQHTKYRN